MAESWDWSDAWVAKSIAGAAAEGPADLADVIGQADVLNHAILLQGELEQAVQRLLGAGLVSLHGDKLAVSEAGKAVTAHAKGGLFSQVDGVARRLKRIPVVKAQWSLEPSKFDAAVDEYFDRAKGLR